MGIDSDRMKPQAVFFLSIFYFFFFHLIFSFSFASFASFDMDFKPSGFHYADDRKHSKDSRIQKDKENERKKNLAIEKDLEKVNRELCPTCPRSGNDGVTPKCPIEIPADPIRCPPREGCPPLPRCPACEPLPYTCKKPKDPSCPAESGTCGAQQQIGQGIKTKK